MKYLYRYFLMILLFPVLASAHGPSRQKVEETMMINASTDKIWQQVSDFCTVSKWHPEITSCRADNGSEIDSIRTIELKNGETITEKLFKRDEDRKRIIYAMERLEKGRIIPGLPVSTLSTTISVADKDGGAMVTFKGAFYRAFTGPQPPPELSDTACIKAVTALYQSGLTGLKAFIEQ